MSRIKISLNRKRIRRLIWLVLTVFLLLGYSLQSVAGSVSYSLVMQAYGMVSSPPVILEEGNVTGANTIYANGTSAKVSVATPIAPPALIFESGFETGDFTEWAETDYADGCSITIVTSPTHEGSYAARSYTDNPDEYAVARKVFSQLYDTLFGRCYTQFTALPAADGDIFRSIYILHVATSAPWYRCLVAAGIKNVAGTSKWYLQYRDGTVFSELTADTPLPEANKWYCIEIKAVRSGTAGEARLYIGGAEVLSATGLDNNEWTDNSRFEVGLGGDPSNNATTIYVDCVKVADTYIGPEAYDFVDNISDVDSSSDKGTHSNFTAQQYGPDLINDTLTEGNTGGGATGITPITAFQDTQQSTSSTSLADANCETSALSNGVKYLVIYGGNHGGGGISDVTEMVLEFGTTVIARSIGEGRGQSNHYDTNTIEGYYIVTGDGTNTLKFRFRLVSGSGAYCGAMAIIAIPLTDLNENTDYFQSVSNAEDVVVNAAVGSWTTLMTQTFSLPDAGDYLVLMSGEGGCDGGSNADASMMRFRVNGATIGSEYHEEWEDDNDQMNFAKAQLVTGLSAGDNVFAIECQSRGSAVADFHRPRIVVIRKATFDQIVNTYDTSGDTTTSTSFVDFAGLTTTYTPNQAEYVIVLANFGLGGDGTYVATAQLRDETAGANYRVDGGEYNNDGGFDSARDQITVLLAHAKQLTSSTEWRAQYRTTASGTAAIGKNPDNTAGIRSDLILWSMTIAGSGSANYTLDLEVQWTGVDYDEPNEYLCIYGGNMASENLQVDVWNSSQWTIIIPKLNATTWNNISISSYLTSSTFTIRFLGTNETNDVTQSSWDIDATLLHVWTTETYDYILEVVNQVADNWTVNLQVYDNSNIGRLSSLNIGLHDGTSSNQIAVSGGSIVQSEGEPYNLPGGINSTIYISISNLQATTTGTSYLYVHLKILVPNTSTYILYIINFEIT